MRKRSKYKPREIMIDTLGRAVWKAKRIDDSTVIGILSNISDAINRLKNCTQSIDDWGQIFLAVNMVEGFIKTGFISKKLPGNVQFIHDMQDVITDILNRHEETKSNVLTPSEINAMQDLYQSLRDIMYCEELTNGHYEEVRQYVENRIRSVVGKVEPSRVAVV